MKSQIEINGITIDLEKRKGMKKMYLRVNPPHGNVSLRLPYGVAPFIVEKFVLENWKIIQEEVERVKLLKNINRIDDGTSVKIWGKDLRLNIKEGKKSHANIEGGEVYMEIKGQDSQEKRLHVLEDLHRKELARVAGPILEGYEEKMGLNIKEWRIKKMKTRWGSCNVKEKRIWLNLGLASYPKSCLEMVIVHELTHLIERGHNERFYRILEEYFPNWEDVDEILKGR